MYPPSPPPFESLNSLWSVARPPTGRAHRPIRERDRPGALFDRFPCSPTTGPRKNLWRGQNQMSEAFPQPSSAALIRSLFDKAAKDGSGTWDLYAIVDGSKFDLVPEVRPWGGEGGRGRPTSHSGVPQAPLPLPRPRLPGFPPACAARPSPGHVILEPRHRFGW